MEEIADAGHGYDELGLHAGAVRRAAAWAGPLYDHYFRVESHGHQHLPATGPAILIANHSGMLPLDGAMLWLDVRRRARRTLRPVGDHFVSGLPLIGTWFARAGVVSGTRANVRWLLERGALLAIFPEGTAGVAKPPRERYRLQRWTVGHAELAIRHRVPIVPVAIVGAEEAWPLALRLRWLRPFGAPYLPVPWSPVPLPVRFHLRYGEPLVLHAGTQPDDADDPAVVAAAALRTRDAVAGLLERALAERAGRSP